MSFSFSLSSHNKMASEVTDSADLGENVDNNISYSSVSKLISSLKSSFRADDFAKVEADLLAKDEKSRMKIETLKQQYDSILSKYEDERLESLSLADKLKKCENELSKSREENMVFKQRNKSAGERYEKLLEELKRTNKEMSDLRNTNIEIESGKAKAEDELKIYEKRFEELEKRVLKLESDLPLLKNLQDLKSNGTEDEIGSSENVRIKPDETVKVEKVSIDLSCGSPAKANGRSGNAACMPGNGRPPSQNMVEIVDIDSDEDSAPGGSMGEENGTADLKRKRTSSIDAGEHVNDDNSLNDKLKMKKFEEPVCRPDDCPINRCSMTTISSVSFEVHRDLATQKNDFMVSRPHEQQPESEQKSQNIMNGFPLDGLDFHEESSCSSDSDSEDDNDDVHIIFNHSQIAPESQREKRN